jgi:endonuclease/exonuclease/phosphatase family metal-dependent hydrolase
MNLISWNVQWFCGLDDVVSVERVIDEARSMADFDVLCLQEVAINYPPLTGNAGFDQVAKLQELLPGYQVFFGAAVHEYASNGQVQQFGNVVATRLAVSQVQHYPLPYPADAGVRSMPRMCTSVCVMTPMGPVRVMTTHLEYYSRRQRMEQAAALPDLHAQACNQAIAPPLHDTSGAPFQAKVHTASAILCGDFNFEADSEEYRRITSPTSAAGPTRLLDVWALLHGSEPHPATFHLFDKRYGPDPIGCDFAFISADLQPFVQSMEINSTTQASDHQPLLVRFNAP